MRLWYKAIMLKKISIGFMVILGMFLITGCSCRI